MCDGGVIIADTIEASPGFLRSSGLSLRRRVSSAVGEGLRAPSIIYPCAALIATGAYFLLPAGAAKDILFILIGLFAAAAVVIGVRANRPGRPLPWWLVASGLGMVIAGDATSAFYQHVLRVAEYPFPSVSDALYIGAYPLLAAGPLLMRGRGIAHDRAGLIDPLIVATGVGVVYWTFLLGPVAEAHELSLAQRLVNVAYPITDVLLLAVLARFLLLAGGPERRLPAYYLVVAGLSLLLVSDVVSDALALSGVYELVAGVYEPAVSHDYSKSVVLIPRHRSPAVGLRGGYAPRRDRGCPPRWRTRAWRAGSGG